MTLESRSRGCGFKAWYQQGSNLLLPLLYCPGGAVFGLFHEMKQQRPCILTGFITCGNMGGGGIEGGKFTVQCQR